ncbi:hypothetical protein [Aeromicrobium wangtongii]|uniref:hypothetical protein n=1 Tax=Aeromicrobium wangtongii TaxID=2969247 RepID=UPI002016C330|nr:hypothetical protein [Aeromicrobium wangtongii]MCL3817033.1 hypothetical protein [Aeromicrobium wangtongii]
MLTDVGSLRRLMIWILSPVVVMLGLVATASPASAALCHVTQADGSIKVVDCDKIPGNAGDPGSKGGAPSCVVKDGDTGCWNGKSCYIKDPAEYGDSGAAQEQLGPKPSEDAHAAFRLCNAEEGPVWYWTEADEPSQAELAAQAFGQLVAPSIAPTFNPPTRTLVNLPTWWWAAGASDQPLSASAGSVTVTATPSHMEVDPGDGSAIFGCRPFVTVQSDSCTYTYRRAGKGDGYPARMRLVWTVVFTDTDAPIDVPDLPTTFDSGWSGVTVPVHEVQTLNRSSR